MKYLFLFLIVFAISCANLQPPRDFEVKLYLILEDGCLVRDGEAYICPWDEDYPSNFIGLSLEDYEKERKYQRTLINSCRKWK